MENIKQNNDMAGTDSAEQVTEELISFIQESPTAFHAVYNMEKLLLRYGFTKLSETREWKLEPGNDYFVTRGNSSLIAFRVPEQPFENFQIVAAHSDSPMFKVKPDPEITFPGRKDPGTDRCAGGYVRLNVEKYGGMLCAPWLDRPLSLAGRVVARDDTSCMPGLRSVLINFDRDLCLIPNLAIHMNRNVNDGYAWQVQTDMLPVLCEAGTAAQGGILRQLAADELDLEPDAIEDMDLFLYNRTPGTIWGADSAFFSSPRVDDLQCAWSAVRSLIDGANDTSVCVAAVFDNEEVGSRTMQGADSTFLEDTLTRISGALGKTPEQHRMAVSAGFMVSADNAHAVHPAHPEAADPTNRPFMNLGPVIKYHAAQKYTTDAVSGAVFRRICEKAGVPCQTFANHSDKPGGSTLGNLSNAHVALHTVDIGMAQLAMHSPYETAGVRDTLYLLQALTMFYRTHIVCNEEEAVLL